MEEESSTESPESDEQARVESPFIGKDLPGQDFDSNEPYLGIWWAVYMLLLFAFKKIFPLVPYSFLWWCWVYYLFVIVLCAVFTIYKRQQHHRIIRRLEREDRAAGLEGRGS